MKRFVYLLYGVACYAIFLAAFLYLVGFVSGWVVPKSVDSGATAPVGIALIINALLVGLFGLQHSVMARPAFKRAWTRAVPEPLERSTYVLLTSLCLGLIYWQWRPLPGVVWSVEGVGAWILTGLFLAGVGLALVSTFLIDHFDLFGLRQVVLYWRGREYRPPGFATPLLYRLVRHPLYLGLFLVFWATPEMTLGHLLFAALMSGYVLFAVHLEERDLLSSLGADYRAYRERTPAYFPGFKRRPSSAPPSQGA